MLFPTERTKQGQLRFPGSEVSALAPYRVCVHQIPNISTKLSQSEASQLLSKRRKIDEPDPISCLATSAVSPHSQGMRGQQCQSLLSLLPVGTKCRDFTSQPRNFFSFFFLVTLLCPAHCPLGKCPPSCLCSSHNLCFVYCHINIYNSKPLWFPAQTERDALREFSAFTIWIKGLCSPDTHQAEGQGGEVRERPQK